MSEIPNDNITEDDERELRRIEDIKYILTHLEEYDKMRAKLIEIRDGDFKYKYVPPLGTKQKSDSDKDQ